MGITLKRTLVKIGGSLRLTIPPEVADLLHVHEGDEIEFSTSNGDIIIKKVKG
jgi:AbrB family looped-hinge helix DNA binding protein